MATYTNVIEKVRPSIVGKAQIVHDTPSPIERMRGSMQGQPLTRDTYCRLIIGGRIYMTDAEFERVTNAELMRAAHGDVLIAGLGIGLILDPLFDKCRSVTVIEKDQDVISLVAPAFPKVRVIHADIFKWTPAAQSAWDTIYFDIWADVCRDDIAECRKLERKFSKYLRDGGYMQSWSRIACDVLARSRGRRR